jgi:hypothetical protein
VPPPVVTKPPQTVIPPDGTLIQEGGTNQVYQMENGQRRWMVNDGTLQCMNPTHKPIQNLPTDQINAIPKGPPYLSRSDHTIIQGSTSTEVWMMLNCLRHRAPDPWAESIKCNGGDPATRVIVEDNELSTVPAGSDLKPCPTPNNGGPKPTRTETFLVSVYAGSSLAGECKRLESDPSAHFSVGSGWVIDKTQGDAGHPGVHEESADDNANNRMHGYNYQAQDDHTVLISGEICGAAFWGPGATFKHTYTVYETQ